MALIAEFSLDSPALKTTRESCPDVTVTVEQETAYEGEQRLVFWAEHGDLDAFEAELEADPSVASVALLSELRDRRLYRVVFSEAAEATYPAWVSVDGVLLRAVGTETDWQTRMRFPDRSALSRYFEYCRSRGLDVTLTHLYSREEEVSEGTYGLTASQEEILVRAAAAGYFQVPRETTLGDLAADLGISGQAASERLRRGLATLVDETVVKNRSGGEASSVRPDVLEN